jgi:hypothetical protein
MKANSNYPEVSWMTYDEFVKAYGTQRPEAKGRGKDLDKRTIIEVIIIIALLSAGIIATFF